MKYKKFFAVSICFCVFMASYSFAKTGSYLQVDPGVEIYYESHGTGSPIIFIPGWTFTEEVFINQVSHFSKTNQVITYDPRSQGRSTTTLHGNDYVTHGSDLVKLIEALKLKDVVLVGWSFGCLTMWEYIKQQGVSNVKATACIDLSPKPLTTVEGDWSEGPLDEIAGAYNVFLRDAKGQRDFVTYYATNVMVQRKLTEEELFWINEQSLKTPYYIAAQLFASGMFSNYVPEAKKLDKALPVLFIVAEHWSKTANAFVSKNFPHSKIETLGGHMMFWEHPKKFNRLLGNFIKAL